YMLFNFFCGFEQHLLHLESWDLTTFQSLKGSLHSTQNQMCGTNSIQIMHKDVTFLLHNKIPEYMIPFVDDIPIHGPPM
ncbi:hypothetical protein DACRYDRAFT_54697, partial [Dacryopinax primogenitus]